MLKSSSSTLPLITYDILTAADAEMPSFVTHGISTAVDVEMPTGLSFAIHGISTTADVKMAHI
jgi:hypothetical protein